MRDASNRPVRLGGLATILSVCALFAAPGLAVPATAVSSIAASPGRAPAPLAAPNPIAAENALPGTSGWMFSGQVADDSANQIKGYWSATSVKQSSSISLAVTVNPVQTYTLDVYRLGWYGGLGGRLRLHVGPLVGISQSACVPNADSGEIACDWVSSYVLTVPADWVSGVYVGMLTNAAGFQNYTTFVVRDDRPADFLYQQSIATDQAYNNYPNDNSTGKSLYTFNSFGANTISGETRAVKVSFDRPYRDYGFGSTLFDSIEFIRWIERSGYDVTYATDVDVHANGAMLRDHKGVLDVGHDEYWSKQNYDALEAARDAGVGLAFFAADTGSVQVRYEPSSSGAADRVIVCYKNWALDPASPGPTTTVPFRDWPLDRPEQTLRGVLSGWMLAGQDNFPFVVQNSGHWIYEGTGFHDGDSVPGIVGYEMDSYRSEYAVPNSNDWTLLSSSPFVDFQGVSRVSNSSLYQAPSGAWVFSSGTISWSWGLDGLWHQRADARIQRTTANLLAAFLQGAPSSGVAQLAASGPPTATAGAPFTVSVAAVDAQGKPVATYAGTVHWSSTDRSSAAVLPADAQLTNGQGSFSVTLATAGPQVVTISDADARSATVTVDVAPAPADHLALSTAAAPTAGTAFPFSVAALDRFGNAATTYAGTLRFTSSDASAGVALPADSSLSGGQGTFSATLTKAGPQTITATDTTAGSVTGSLSVTVSPGAAAVLVLDSPATATAGRSFAVKVTMRDAYANVATGYGGTVSFATDDPLPTVSLPADYAFTAADAGSHSFSVRLWTVGERTLAARDKQQAALTDTNTIDVRLF